jgi:8-oxo-dGTP pyrophosphatase MutT (NUDIX family)
MRIVEQLTDQKFLNIKRVQDPEKGVNGYLFAERLGTDSIAFICYDPDKKLILLNNEYKPPVDQFILGAFGGSLDKGPETDLLEIVKAEAKEEGGFDILKDVINLGKLFVSTQMNQFCHMFLVIVDKDDEGEREPENAVEALATTKWVGVDEIEKLRDWKAMGIVFMAERAGLISS